MDNKPKLMINRNILMSEKSPPPTKLLINHGKPNFTIVKSPKILSPPPKEENIFSGTDLKPSSLRKKTPPKTVLITNGTTNEAESSDEFLRLHKKIGGRNFDDIENNNTNGLYENGEEAVAVVKNSPQIDLHFATIQTNGILTLKHPHETNGHSEPSMNKNQITNGFAGHEKSTHEKSPTPEKLETLRVVSSNQSSRTPSPFSKSSSSTNQSMESLSSNSGVNFEQRTVVSFARDLSVTPNRYPDTVKTEKTVQSDIGIATLPREFADLKFEIASDGDLVRPVVKKST